LHPALDRRHEENPVALESLDGAGPPNPDIALTVRAHTRLGSEAGPLAPSGRIVRPRDRKTIHVQRDVRHTERDAGSARDPTGDVSDQARILRAQGWPTLDVFS
jgi:hypothetical protein